MAWNQYRRLLQTHPFKTKAATSAFVTGLADVGLQLYEQNSITLVYSSPIPRQRRHAALGSSASPQPCDLSLPTVSVRMTDVKWSRTLTLAAVGLVYSGPVNHLWFAALEKVVQTRHHVGSVLAKLVADQLLFVPTAISGYLIVRAIFEGKTELQILTQVREKVPVATEAAWQFWPFVNLVSFSVVPVMYRVLFGNMCAVFWNARLSSISSQAADASQEASTSSVSRIEAQRLRHALESFFWAAMDQTLMQAFEELAILEE